MIHLMTWMRPWVCSNVRKYNGEGLAVESYGLGSLTSSVGIEADVVVEFRLLLTDLTGNILALRLLDLQSCNFEGEFEDLVLDLAVLEGGGGCSASSIDGRIKGVGLGGLSSFALDLNLA